MKRQHDASSPLSLAAQIALRCVGYALTLFVVCFPTLLLLIGIGMLGFEYDWHSLTTYGGIIVMALLQLSIRLLLSDVRDTTFLERIFTFPKR